MLMNEKDGGVEIIGCMAWNNMVMRRKHCHIQASRCLLLLTESYASADFPLFIPKKS